MRNGSVTEAWAVISVAEMSACRSCYTGKALPAVPRANPMDMQQVAQQSCPASMTGVARPSTSWMRHLCECSGSAQPLVTLPLGLDTLRQQVQDEWSEARLQVCLPRLRRFVCLRPRRRGHQESITRVWLEQRARAHPDRQLQVA
jgi:hypothetical protein